MGEFSFKLSVAYVIFSGLYPKVSLGNKDMQLLKVPESVVSCPFLRQPPPPPQIAIHTILLNLPALQFPLSGGLDGTVVGRGHH